MKIESTLYIIIFNYSTSSSYCLIIFILTFPRGFEPFDFSNYFSGLMSQGSVECTIFCA